MTPEEFDNKVNNAQSLEFGEIFDSSLELFKKIWVARAF